MISLALARKNHVKIEAVEILSIPLQLPDADGCHQFSDGEITKQWAS